MFTPVRMVHQPCHQLDKVTEGRSPEDLMNTPKGVPTLQLRLIIYMELSNGHMQKIQLKSYKLPIDWQLVITMNSRSQGVDSYSTLGSAFHETITAIALWRHKSCRWDNAAATAAHRNAASRKMALTFKCLQHFHISRTNWYRYHLRKTQWYGYADHVGYVRSNSRHVLDK